MAPHELEWPTDGFLSMLKDVLRDSHSKSHHTLAEGLVRADMLPLVEMLWELDDFLLGERLKRDAVVYENRAALDAIAAQARRSSDRMSREIERLQKLRDDGPDERFRFVSRRTRYELMWIYGQSRDKAEADLAALETIRAHLGRTLFPKAPPERWPTLPRRIREFTIADRTLKILRAVAERCSIEPPKSFGTPTGPIVKFTQALQRKLWPADSESSAGTFLNNLQETKAVVAGKRRSDKHRGKHLPPRKPR
jgi:hypothetical protein